jgi:hypothetical protein
MRPTLVWLLALTLGLAGCGGTSGATATSGETGGSATALPQGDEPFEMDPANFTSEIDNPYWPMVPGTTWTYEETDDEGVTQQIEVTVTDETREIMGIESRVVRDVVTEDGEVIEDTFDWYAQDADGNVWYMGEDTTEFENGEPVSKAGSWEAGVDGAMAGIVMPADPQPGMAYRQEYYEGEAEDNGAVLAVEEFVEVPHDSYDDVIMTRDSTPLEPDMLEYKFYARDVGQVMTLQVSGGSAREVLVDLTTP